MILGAVVTVGQEGLALVLSGGRDAEPAIVTPRAISILRTDALAVVAARTRNGGALSYLALRRFLAGRSERGGVRREALAVAIGPLLTVET